MILKRYTARRLPGPMLSLVLPASTGGIAIAKSGDNVRPPRRQATLSGDFFCERKSYRFQGHGALCPQMCYGEALGEVPMLDKAQKYALYQWYSRDEVLGEAESLIDKEEWEILEELIQMRALFPLSRHSALPDYLLNDEGKPLVPSNCDPRKDEEAWQDAIEVGWKVIKDRFGLVRDEIHLRIKEQQETSWEGFLRSVDERKKRHEKPKS